MSSIVELRAENERLNNLALQRSVELCTLTQKMIELEKLYDEKLKKNTITINNLIATMKKLFTHIDDDDIPRIVDVNFNTGVCETNN